ncbi:MAG TPA: hypothetical protein VHX88_08955 [Solirubrobacteraceae bacterium]|jgi:hypothetical protein|nr:hypothetical protein [Solirubrobacteraceae bacterium]
MSEPRLPYAEAWPRDSEFEIVQTYHSAVRALMAQRLADDGRPWEQAVLDPAFGPTRADFERIEADVLASGRRFEPSATVSLREEPEKYNPLAGITDSGEQVLDEEGRRVVGTGDNVFRAKADIEGTARYVSDIDVVMDMLDNGVPQGTIAVIDDSGGTLTAPILGQFTAIVCLGGTTRSHLGILSREYWVPCLMNARLDGLADGDRILVEYSRPAADAYADAEAAEAARARIVKVS